MIMTLCCDILAFKCRKFSETICVTGKLYTRGRCEFSIDYSFPDYGLCSCFCPMELMSHCIAFTLQLNATEQWTIFHLPPDENICLKHLFWSSQWVYKFMFSTACGKFFLNPRIFLCLCPEDCPYAQIFMRTSLRSPWTFLWHVSQLHSPASQVMCNMVLKCEYFWHFKNFSPHFIVS